MPAASSPPGRSGRVCLDVSQPSPSDSPAPSWLQTEAAALDIPLPERGVRNKEIQVIPDQALPQLREGGFSSAPRFCVVQGEVK